MLEFKKFLIEVPGGLKVELNGHVSPDQIFCIRGPSGIGKTTVLRAIAGLRRNLSGQLLLNGHDLTSQRPEARRTGYLLQGSQLVPALNVGENLRFALEIRHPEWSEALRIERVREILKRAGLEKLIDQSTRSLSGGEAQRIALCRVFLCEAAFFLLDEPFTGLDPDSRQFFRNWLKDELKLRQRPTVMVSHDTSDATDLGAQIIEWPQISNNQVSLSFS